MRRHAMYEIAHHECSIALHGGCCCLAGRQGCQLKVKTNARHRMPLLEHLSPCLRELEGIALALGLHETQLHAVRERETGSRGLLDHLCMRKQQLMCIVDWHGGHWDCTHATQIAHHDMAGHKHDDAARNGRLEV